MGSKFIGAGLATIALAGAGVGIGAVSSTLFLERLRNPGLEKQLFAYAIFALSIEHFKKAFLAGFLRSNFIFLLLDINITVGFVIDYSVEIAIVTMVLKGAVN
jgi:hypothetical protein